MKRFLINIEYLGTNYNGFQLQKSKTLKTVQGELENALKQVFLKEVKVFSCGRLDAGVHALSLKAHFDVESGIKAVQVPHAINHFLPLDISVTSAKEVDENFHARFQVKQKTYQYNLYVSKYRHATKDVNSMQLVKKPNITLMKEAIQYFLGTHDFTAFSNKNSSIKTTVRTVNSLTIEEAGDRITITISGKAFLYNMVRIIVGTLLEVGYGKFLPEQITQIINSKSRDNAGKMVEAKGLTLISVEY
jgi:tRNA pseudouridine38-40 synthase